jgi:R3H domain
MSREDGGRRDPRRPRRGRERDRDRERDPAQAKERIEREFAREIEMRISYFLQSPEEELELEPMNSYRRRMVHNIAGKYHLRSESRGEDRERYVCLVKTSESAAAPPPPSRVRLWDYGSQTFPVNPGKDGAHVALMADGSVELWRGHERGHVLADRVVHSHEFRIRQGKILVPGEPGY